MRHGRSLYGNRKGGRILLTPNDSGTRKWNVRRCQELHMVNFVTLGRYVQCTGFCGAHSIHYVQRSVVTIK